ncbi:MAG: hypothetical protein JXB32_07405 [Deltaproteobacteria bacterium]|nr:hypothetical protein [Deltaproteobacteria bacterium]
MKGTTSRFRPAAAFVAGALALLAAVPAAAELTPSGARVAAAASVTFEAATQTYHLRAESTPPVVYSIPVAHPDVAAGLLRITATVGSRAPVVVVSQGGTRYRDAAGTLREPAELAAHGTTTLTEHRLDGDAVLLRYAESPGAHDLQKTFRFRLQGISLALELASDSTAGLDGYAGVMLGATEATPGAVVRTLPFLPEPIGVLPDGTYFTAFVDRTTSSASSVTAWLGPRDASSVYAHAATRSDLDTAGAAAPLVETAWVTVSERLEDVFPEPSRGPSTWRADLGRRLVLDVWGLQGSFGGDEGVTLLWRAPASALGTAHVTLRYAASGGGCGDGVALAIRRGPVPVELLERLVVPPEATTPRTWETDLALAEGTEVRVDLLRAGGNSCDGTQLRLTVVTAGGETFDSQTDFSSTQGDRGFYYLELLGETLLDMTWNAAESRWEGGGAYSILGPGWGHPGQGASAYRDGAAMVRRMVEYGLRELAIIFHVWQRWGYDEGLPDHHPANPAWGTGAELAAFAAAARDAGMLLALHENYTDLYPDDPPDHPSPLFDATAIALDSSGARRLGWYQEATGQQAFRIAAGRMLGFAQAESAAIAADYGPTAAYLDVNTGWMPGIAIDFNAASPDPPTFGASFDAHVALYDWIRDNYGGPLLGEGGEGVERFDSYYAGAVDGVERQIEGRHAAPVAPEYELRVVKPRMMNHGLGYYSRYFTDQGQENVDYDEAALDQYRASEIAFGHAGFLGDGLGGAAPATLIRHFAREYRLLQALQTRYAEAVPVRITYDDGGTPRTLGEAWRAGTDLAAARIAVEYEGGLTVRVNRDAARRTVGAVSGYSYEQGANGFGYHEEGTGGALVPMAWDAATRRWHGTRPFSMLWEYGGHPDGPPIVRSWTSPVAGRVRVTGGVSDANPSCGDGVDVEIRHGATTVWSYALENGDEDGTTYDLSLDAAVGDVLAFRIAQRADNYCDSTHFAPTISWDDGAAHDWTVSTAGGEVVLPPSGFVAEGPDGFVARSALQGGRRTDFVRAPEYLYAGVRDGATTTIENVAVDGAIAFVAGPHGDDLHGTALTIADRDGLPALRVSARADVNLRMLDPRRALVVARHAEGAFRVDVHWGALPAAWQAVLGAHPDEVEWSAADEDGTPLGTPTPLDASGGFLGLAGMALDQSYLVRITSPCVVESECGAGEGCLEGRCVSGAADGDADGDGDADTDVGADADVDVDGGADADGGSDGGPGADGGGGCGCSAPGAGAGLGALLLLLAMPLAGSRRRRPGAPGRGR